MSERYGKCAWCSGYGVIVNAETKEESECPKCFGDGFETDAFLEPLYKRATEREFQEQQWQLAQSWGRI